MWFFMLFIAAITASSRCCNPCIAFLEEGFGLKRHASAAMLGLIAAFGCGFVLYFSKGSVALDTFDFWVGTFLIFILAMFQTILYGWVFGIERGHEELHEGANMRIPQFVQYVLKYVTPGVSVIIFVTFCWTTCRAHDDGRPSSTPDVAGGRLKARSVDALASSCRREESTLPEDATLVADGDAGLDDQRRRRTPCRLAIQPTATTACRSSLQVGYVENAVNNRVAFARSASLS